MYKILFILSFLFILNVKAQTNQFTKNNKLNPDFNLDIQKIGIDLNVKSSQIIIRGVVFDPSLVQSEYDLLENWMDVFTVDNLNVHFDIFTTTTQEGINLNFQNSTELVSKKLTRSTLFIFVRDTLIRDYLDENLRPLSLENIKHSDLSIYQLIEIKSLDDFKWKTKLLLYNLEHFEAPEKKTENLKINKNHFQLGITSSVSNTNSINFDDFTSQEIDLHAIRSIKSSNLQIGAGISFLNYQFRSTDNALYSISNSPTLDTVYASVIGVNQEYQNLSLLLKAFFTYKVPINSNYLGISISPFYAIYNKQNCIATNGQITTFGKINGINEYLYEINELGLRTFNAEQLNQNTSLSASTIGMNLTIGYEFQLKSFSIAPTFDFKFISIKNKNEILESYSLNTSVYNGFFSTQKGANFFSPSIGISIIF
jgi:hypothetical protein